MLGALGACGAIDYQGRRAGDAAIALARTTEPAAARVLQFRGTVVAQVPGADLALVPGGGVSVGQSCLRDEAEHQRNRAGRQKS